MFLLFVNLKKGKKFINLKLKDTPFYCSLCISFNISVSFLIKFRFFRNEIDLCFYILKLLRFNIRIEDIQVWILKFKVKKYTCFFFVLLKNDEEKSNDFNA